MLARIVGLGNEIYSVRSAYEQVVKVTVGDASEYDSSHDKSRRINYMVPALQASEMYGWALASSLVNFQWTSHLRSMNIANDINWVSLNNYFIFSYGPSLF